MIDESARRKPPAPEKSAQQSTRGSGIGRNLAVLAIVSSLIAYATMLLVGYWDSQKHPYDHPVSLGAYAQAKTDGENYPIDFINAIDPYATPLNYITTRVDLSPEELDKNGAFKVSFNGDNDVYHPVSLLWLALPALTSYQATGNPKYLAAAEATADKLLAGSELHDGARFFPYRFDFSPHGDRWQKLKAPWYSGMAQGMALSLLSRLHHQTGKEKYGVAAAEVFKSLNRTSGQPRVTFVDENDHLWIEEYVGNQPFLHVINGHIWAMFGLADYYGDSKDPAAQQLFTLAAKTLIDTFPQWSNKGGVSYYCAAKYCHDRGWQPQNYHVGVAFQLQVLAQYTHEPRLREMGRELSQGYPLPRDR